MKLPKFVYYTSLILCIMIALILTTALFYLVVEKYKDTDKPEIIKSTEIIVIKEPIFFNDTIENKYYINNQEVSQETVEYLNKMFEIE